MSNTNSYLLLGAAALAAYVYYNRQKHGAQNSPYAPMPLPVPVPEGENPVTLKQTRFAAPAPLDFPDNGAYGGVYARV